MMDIIRALCTLCGKKLSLSAQQLKLYLTPPECYSYEFSCPECGGWLLRSATDRTAIVLKAVGVPIVDRRRPPLSDAEIAAFVAGLDGDWARHLTG